MRVIEQARGRRQWNSMGFWQERQLARLWDRFHAEQSEAVAFVRDFVRVFSAGTEEEREGVGRASPESLVEPNDVLLLRHVAALYELMTREAGHRLHRLERSHLENALQRLMFSRMDPAAAARHLSSGCAQPEVFTGIQDALMRDFSTRPSESLVGALHIVRVLLDAFDAAADPDETASDEPEGIWSLDRVEEALSVSGEPMRREALAAAESVREALAPRLVAELERWLSNPAVMDTGDPALLLHALFLLAAWREPAAVDPFLRLFCANEFAAYPPITRARMIHGGHLLASVVGRSPERILEMIRDNAVNEFCRGVALQALGFLFAWKEINRPWLLQNIRDLFGGKLTPRRPGFEWYALLDLVMRLGLTEVAAEAEQALWKGHVDPALLSIRSFQETMRAFAGSEISDTSPGYGRRVEVASVTSPLDDDPFEVQERLAMEQILDGGFLSTSEVPLPYVAPVAVGRNDPCPCGSGRKYKKCCDA